MWVGIIYCFAFWGVLGICLWVFGFVVFLASVVGVGLRWRVWWFGWSLHWGVGVLVIWCADSGLVCLDFQGGGDGACVSGWGACYKWRFWLHVVWIGFRA